MVVIDSVQCKGIVECTNNNPESFDEKIYPPVGSTLLAEFEPAVSIVDVLSGSPISFWQAPNTVDISGFNLMGIPSTGVSENFPQLSWTREVIANTPIYFVSCDGFNWMFEPTGFPNGQYFPSYDAQVMKGYPASDSSQWRFTVILTFQRNSWWILSTQEHTGGYIGAYWKYTEHSAAAAPQSVDEDDLWILFDPENANDISPLKIGDRVCIKSAYFFDTQIPSDPGFMDQRGFLIFQSIANRCFVMPDAGEFMIPSLVERSQVRSDGADNTIANGDNTNPPYCTDFDCSGPICNMQLTFQIVPFKEKNKPFPDNKKDFATEDQVRALWITFGVLFGVLALIMLSYVAFGFK